jgi:putative BNR repeat neuraminidase
MKTITWMLALAVAGTLLAAAPPGLITFNDDGAWCWYQDERVIVHDGKLIIGSVAAGVDDPMREGDIDATVYDLSTGATTRVELHDRLGSRSNSYDDHNVPAFLTRPDGRVLAVYSKHGPEPHFYYRITERANDPTKWSPVRKYEASPTTRLTYSNLLLLRNENGGRGRVYDFFRGLDDSFKPSFAFSDDAGESWETGNVVIDVPTEQRHRPYVKYATNGEDTIHLFYSEGHPHVYPNSVYHVFYRDGNLHRSDGTVIRSLKEGLRKPEEGTRIFAGSKTHRAWTSELHVDSNGHPVAGFSVKVDAADSPVGSGGLDHRYHYARWTGSEWTEHEIAYGGSRLYWWQDDYTGNMAIDPDHPETVFISTDADPVTGAPLKSRSDGARHFEIYKGVTADSGATWNWTAITKESRIDNIRPIVPAGTGDHSVVLWLRGTYTSYVNYDLDIVGLVN